MTRYIQAGNRRYFLEKIPNTNIARIKCFDYNTNKYEYPSTININLYRELLEIARDEMLLLNEDDYYFFV